MALAEGADVDLTALEQLSRAASDEMRSSMQRDLESRRAPELDAIAGPILRGGRAHHLETPAVEELVAKVQARVATGGRADRALA